MVFALWAEDDQTQVADETKHNQSNPHLDSARKGTETYITESVEGKCSGGVIVTESKAKENALIVLTAGLLILSRWVLILLNFCSTAAGLKVWLLALEWESAGGKGEEELETMVGWENAVPIEVTSSSKVTKAGSSRVVFWEVEERANLREYWFCCELVSSVASWFAWMHWCCFLVWWTAKNGSFLCCCFVKETEYPFFMSIQNRWRTTPLVCWLPWRFQIINNNNSYWS